MSSNLHPIEELAALLKESTAKPLIVPARLAPSALYDVEYRTAVIALVFARFARTIAPSTLRKISAAKLKLMQFVALRPWLLPAIREWSTVGPHEGLAFAHSIRIRRGFLSDTAHDDVVNYLTACRILARQDTQIVEGKHADVLVAIAKSVVEANLFSSELAVINELDGITISNQMLEGW
ncbi:hypothetical protein DYQ86_09530 [Acidobacteria bacterium AB60]|nr:hypothetical protein DYQ86_09530 [Acidobacteria bacterium AB60]